MPNLTTAILDAVAQAVQKLPVNAVNPYSVKVVIEAIRNEAKQTRAERIPGITEKRPLRMIARVTAKVETSSIVEL